MVFTARLHLLAICEYSQNGIDSIDDKDVTEMATTTQQLQKSYDRAAWFYEKSAKFYSTNQIRESKRQQLKHIQRGDKVLFLGAGSGEDAVMAAEKGALVTCIDISQGLSLIHI